MATVDDVELKYLHEGIKPVLDFAAKKIDDDYLLEDIKEEAEKVLKLSYSTDITTVSILLNMLTTEKTTLVEVKDVFGDFIYSCLIKFAKDRKIKIPLPVNKVQTAINFATMKHKNQVRKGTDLPYIVHPMEVMYILTHIGCTEDVIIGGILHDTLEDTDTTPEEIENFFGREVLDLVQHESEDKSKTWKERKQTTIDSLKNASDKVKLICFADKLSNLRSIYRDLLSCGEKVWDRFNNDKASEAWYYKSIYKSLDSLDYLDEYKEYGKLLKVVFG